MRELHQQRLLTVAQALREAPKKHFKMSEYAKMEEGATCGTPACALGHFAARRDLQSFIRIETMQEWNEYEEDLGLRYTRNHGGYSLTYDDERICNYFGISNPEAEELFGAYGCNRATTPKKAAKYIEQFVKRVSELSKEQRHTLSLARMEKQDRAANPFWSC